MQQTKQTVTASGNPPREEDLFTYWRDRAYKAEAQRDSAQTGFSKLAKAFDQVTAQRDELLAAAKAWKYAREEGGISMVDWFQVAWEKTEKAIQTAERQNQ